MFVLIAYENIYRAFEDYKEAEWSSMSQFENHLNEIESTLDATFGSSTYEANGKQLYTCVCN